jgi:hypothetical protein
MEQGPSREANRFSPSPEIPLSLWNPKVHRRNQDTSPTAPILSQINPVIVPHPTYWKSILILSSHLRLGLPSVFLSFRFPVVTNISHKAPQSGTDSDMVGKHARGKQYYQLKYTGWSKVSVHLTITMPHYLVQSDCLAADRQGQGDTRLTLKLSVISNSKYVIMVSDLNCLKYCCVFLYCNHQVHRDLWITLYNAYLWFMQCRSSWLEPFTVGVTGRISREAGL